MIASLLVGTRLAFAATPTSPPNGATTPPTPTFAWALDPSETANKIEISPNPAPGSFGGFADDEDLRLEFLADAQTSYTVGSSEPLFAGVWYWHMQTYDQDFNSRWTPTLSIFVPDEPPKLGSVRIDYLQCIRSVTLDFEHSDNSRNQFVRWQLDFLRKRNSGRLARIVGSTTDEFGTSEFLRVPKRLKAGERYWARLRVIDPAGQRATAKPQAIRLRRC